MENLNTAFDVAEKHLNIPRMLDADGRLLSIAYLSYLNGDPFLTIYRYSLYQQYNRSFLIESFLRPLRIHYYYSVMKHIDLTVTPQYRLNCFSHIQLIDVLII